MTDLSKFEKPYNPSETENRIYRQWLESGYFTPENLPDAKSREPYTIIMPPPNANAPSHVGHALGYTIQDILIRYHRMRGRRTLWLPGSDHAGFETQVVFEKVLEKRGTSRFKMNREEFYQACWDYVQENKHISEEAIKRLGASCDWKRNTFTLDSEVVKVVYETFKQMHRDGLVYRAGRICNWCPKHGTGLSDLETKYEERTEPFYYFKYGPFTIGTSRPETKFGDKYVVMHPDDERYAQYKSGDTFEAEWINGPIRATVIKDAIVDMAFGTGVMTITPAHDPVDFEIAQRHNLPYEEIIDKRGKLLPIAAEFAGMKILEARPQIVEKLAAKGLLIKTDEKYKHSVQMCYKCGTLIEPQVVPQWYVAMTKPIPPRVTVSQAEAVTKPLPEGRTALRDMALSALDRGEVAMVTERFEKIFRHWMENIRDWPISRQIWWGIPIPAWYKRPDQPVAITYFVHGTTVDNETGKSSGHNDAQLSDLGKKQNLDLRAAVAEENFDIVYCSDLARARETAETVFGGRVKIVPDPRLRECDYGKLNGADENEVVPRKRASIDTPFPGGESYRDVEARVRLLLAEIADKHPGKQVALVAHQAPQLAIDVILNGVSWAEAFDRDWRNTKSHRPGWHYELRELIHIGETAPGESWEKDPDTFDTWFSSGQWPYATLMANDAKHNLSPGPSPHEGRVAEGRERSDLETYFPTQVMETAWDILFFWVARMIMFSYYRHGKPPFEKVFLHGLVRDKDRQKMSKSLGNVIDPLGVIDTYGADALRFALIFSTSAGNDIPLAEDKIKGMKHFANKLWNIARFVLSNIEASDWQYQESTEADKEILAKLAETVRSSTQDIEQFRLHEAAQSIYDFTWRELADKYVEASKTQLKDENLRDNTSKILLHCLIATTKLLHPFMPFVTEEIWNTLRERKLVKSDDLLMVQSWPK